MRVSAFVPNHTPFRLLVYIYMLLVGWLDGWMDGWLDGWMDDVCTCLRVVCPQHACFVRPAAAAAICCYMCVGELRTNKTCTIWNQSLA